jgi:hypothetical protein
MYQSNSLPTSHRTHSMSTRKPAGLFREKISISCKTVWITQIYKVTKWIFIVLYQVAHIVIPGLKPLNSTTGIYRRHIFCCTKGQ